MKSKLILVTIILGITQFTNAQKLISKNGHIWFYSYTPVEDIEAHNRQVVSILDPATGIIQFSLLIKSFEFQKKLMQEHFNENYMESDKFPKSSFKGNIDNLSEINFSKDGDYVAQISGKLTIHGVTKEIQTSGTLNITSGKTSAKAKFIVSPEDYDIAIPDLARDNIAKEIEVNVDVTYTMLTKSK